MNIPEPPPLPDAQRAMVRAWLRAWARALGTEERAYRAIGCTDRATAPEVIRELADELKP